MLEPAAQPYIEATLDAP